MQSPLTLAPFSISILDQLYVIRPRLEPIVRNKEIAPEYLGYELLCSVTGSQPITPDVFFSWLSDSDVLRIYHLALQQLPDKETLHITLNVSSSLLKSPALYQLLAMFSHLVFYLELSEKLHGVDDVLIAQQLINKTEGLRAYIWLDDFGSSYANFDSLLYHRFDGIKLAKEVFWGLYEHDRDLLTQLIQFLRKSSGVVIIEGVDSMERFNFVMANDCAAQGYYLRSL